MKDAGARLTGLRQVRMSRSGSADMLAQRLLDRAASYGGEVDEPAGRVSTGQAGLFLSADSEHDVSPFVIPWRRLAAVCFIALAVATWVTEIQVTNDVLGGQGAYDNAYALVWLAHVASGVFGFAVAIALGLCLPPPCDSQPSLKSLIMRPSRDTLVNSFYLSILVNVCSWTWFLSIPLTEAMVNTVIYQSCCVWCFLISVVLLGEKVTLIKVVSTLATFAGVGIISNFPCQIEVQPGQTPSPVDPGTANGRMLWGDFLCLCSAITYALYEVLLKMWGAGGHDHSIELRDGPLQPTEPEPGRTAGAGIVRRLSDNDNDTALPAFDSTDSGLSAGQAAAAAESHGDGLRSSVESAVFVGWMGIWNVMVLWVPLAVCHVTGYQRFDLPSQEQMPFILLDCALEGAYLVWVVLAIALSRLSPFLAARLSRLPCLPCRSLLRRAFFLRVPLRGLLTTLLSSLTSQPLVCDDRNGVSNTVIGRHGRPSAWDHMPEHVAGWHGAGGARVRGHQRRHVRRGPPRLAQLAVMMMMHMRFMCL